MSDDRELGILTRSAGVFVASLTSDASGMTRGPNSSWTLGKSCAGAVWKALKSKRRCFSHTYIGSAPVMVVP
jgi:hypothetical protein